MVAARMIEAQNTILAQEPRDVLDEICHQGARQMLQATLENEVSEYLDLLILGRWVLARGEWPGATRHLSAASGPGCAWR